MLSHSKHLKYEPFVTNLFIEVQEECERVRYTNDLVGPQEGKQKDLFQPIPTLRKLAESIIMVIMTPRRDRFASRRLKYPNE